MQNDNWRSHFGQFCKHTTIFDFLWKWVKLNGRLELNTGGSYGWKKTIRQSERSSKWRSIMVFELEVNDKNDHKAVHFHKKDRSLLSWLLICQSDPNGRLRKIFLANFKMMGWDRLKIWEWVKDALAISKIRIDSWFTRLSIGRL